MAQARKILLVGGNSGIGAALREQLEEDGCELVLAHRSGDPAVDITDDAPAFPEVDGPLHGLAYLPGSILLKPFHGLGVDDFRRDYELNLLGAVKALQAYRRPLQQAGDASVVLFSTVAVRTGMPFHASIAAAKGAVEGLVRSLAAEWAPKVRVNAVAPSLTDTPLAGKLLDGEKKRESAAQRHPLQRYGEPGDIASAAAWLLGPQSGWVTGEVLHVDGGMGAVRTL